MMMMMTIQHTAIAERQEYEDTLLTAACQAFERFLAGTLADATTALDSGVVLAAGRRSSNPFTLGKNMARWEVLSEDLKKAAASLGTQGPQREQDAYLARVKQRLIDSPLSQAAYDSVSEVLRASVEQRWARSTTREALTAALDPNTASVRRTAGGPLEAYGPGWRSQLERIVRTEATSLYGYQTVQRLASEGAERMKWVAQRDEVTRKTHRRAHGQVVRIGESFTVGGYLLAFPGDPQAPLSETANCRCVIVEAG